MIHRVDYNRYYHSKSTGNNSKKRTLRSHYKVYFSVISKMIYIKSFQKVIVIIKYQVGTNIMADFLDECFRQHILKYCFLLSFRNNTMNNFFIFFFQIIRIFFVIFFSIYICSSQLKNTLDRFYSKSFMKLSMQVQPWKPFNALIGMLHWMKEVAGGVFSVFMGGGFHSIGRPL